MIFGLDVVDILIVMVGISLLPLFVDTLNTFIPVGRIVHVYLSRLLIAFLAIQYVASIYYYFTLVIPFYAESSLSMEPTAYSSLQQTYTWTDTYSNYSSWSNFFTIYAIIGSFTALWLWTNTIFSYIQTVRYSPEPIQKTSNNSENLPAGVSICSKCKALKKKGTHHCSQCNRCIPHMDHHCPFTGNCVSTGRKGNFTFFFLFIFYTAMGCAYSVFHMALPFYYCYYERELSERCIPVGSMSLIFIPGVLVLLATGGFTLLHIILIFFGRSTIQFIYWLDGHSKEATPDNIELENQKLQKLNKIHCTPFQFLFPYFIPRPTANKRKLK